MHYYTTNDGNADWKVVKKTKTDYLINRYQNSSGYYVTAYVPSSMVLVYEYQGTPIPDVNKVFPFANAGNKTNFPDIFATSIEKIDNEETIRGRRTRVYIKVTRVDFIGKAYKSSVNGESNNWGGNQFFINLLLANKI